MTATTTDTTPQTNGTTAPKPAPMALATTVDPGDPTRTLSAFSSDANFTSAQRMAKALASSSLVPQSYQDNLPNVLIAIELASRIGASVFAVMQSLDIIHGRPAWRATFLIATVNTGGRFTPLRFRWQGKEGTPEWGCRAVAKDRETSEECVGALITLGLAHAEGWSTKGGSKWKTMPEQMLMYRAAAFWTRVYAPELSLGMHTAEEMRDIDAEPEFRGSLTQVVPGVKSLEAELLATAPPAPASAPSSEPTPAAATPVAEPLAPAGSKARAAQRKAAAPPPAPPAPVAEVKYGPGWNPAEQDAPPPDDDVEREPGEEG